MSPFLQLITDTFRIFLDIIPRIYKISANEMGIKFETGDKIKVLPPGIYVYIPLIHKMQKSNVMNRSVNINRLSLTTKDGKQITIIANINYTITDIKKAIVDNNQVGELITSDVSNEICLYVLNNTKKDIFTNIGDHIKSEKNYQNEYGIKVKKINIMDIGTCFHFNNIDNKDYHRRDSI